MAQDIDVGKLSEQINDKADKDLWNTVPNVWNNTLNTSQITNCITAIPQDIKLELVDGVLTLKAGSKVYVPNGSGKFDEVVISSDLSTTGYHDGQIMVFTQCSSLSSTSINAITEALVSNAKSGTSPEASIYYNTSLNMIYRYTSSSAYDLRFALPIAICTRTSGKITSIDQVFNGFGYIGSTAFALPGVKGLIPNGRNADGSLKNIEFTVDKVVTSTITWNNVAGQELFIGKYNLNDGLQFISTGKIGQYYKQDAEPTKVRYAIWYKPTENKVYRAALDSDGNLVWKDNYPCYIGQWFTSATSPYPITKLTTKLSFRAVDWNDLPTITYWE